VKRQVVQVQTPALVQMWPRMSERERTYTGEAHKYYERELKRVAEVAGPERERIAATEHGLVDDDVTQHLARHPRTGEISCRRGCSHCCHQNVTITEPEAALLLKVTEGDGIPLDWDRVERQAAPSSNGLLAWRALPVEDRGCVFLDEASGECRVYEHRPTGCRKYFVIGNPEHCDIDRHPGKQVLVFAIPPAEIVASAALLVFEHGSLPRMLLKARKRTR
jgi:uncharacterized protein